MVETGWAIEQMRAFIDLTERERVRDTGGVVSFPPRTKATGRHEDIVKQAYVVDQILNNVVGDWRKTIGESSSDRWHQRREACMRAISKIEMEAEIAEKLGDTAPRLSASHMHPWIWDGARSLWQSGHFREAVRVASVKVNAETQNKLGRRDIVETDLFNQAFSDEEPKQGNPRLRLADDDGGKTALSVRRGIRSFAQGCYAGIRNPLSHDVGDVGEGEALEMLAAFSILARWVDGSQVVHA